MLTAIFWSALATGTILIGMALAYRNLVSPRWTGLIMAFGAGAIISAAAYQLVLGAVAEEQGAFMLVGVGIAAGALTFYLADRWVDRLGGADRMDFEGAQASGSGTGILLGSLLDGVPESLVLGLSLVHSPQVSLAFIFAVAISNVPQGLGGAAEMLASGWAKRKLTRLWLVVRAEHLGSGVGTLTWSDPFRAPWNQNCPWWSGLVLPCGVVAATILRIYKHNRPVVSLLVCPSALYIFE
jgi:ZIP family zinc transporter